MDHMDSEADLHVFKHTAFTYKCRPCLLITLHQETWKIMIFVFYIHTYFSGLFVLTLHLVQSGGRKQD